MRWASIFILAAWSTVEGSMEVIHRKELSATVGGNVTLHCQLSQDKDVLQVTWQRESGKTSENIATTSRRHGPRLMGRYLSRASLGTEGRDSSALTLHSASLEDEGCYKCIFNVFPSSPVEGRMCLKIHAISEPQVEIKSLPQVGDEKESEMLEVSCLAMGKPAPEITWDLPHGYHGGLQLHHIWHSNQMVTVISNFTHSPSWPPPEKPATCVIHHPALNMEIELPLPPLHNRKGYLVEIGICFAALLFIHLGLLGYCFWRQKSWNERQDHSWLWVLPCCWALGEANPNVD
ncbi:OX-2 membrane glycoprotein-like [Tachyglossus aculeatus]|uniref:OX-2 membrane glycoprotein-like n=1 Tax=Tachyglossus aculeatus TaxID=9261 RepID=UPI0018F2E2AF|nr:OX-2 membrane glycoprotein-like [Tachyglossus aculeatus]